MSVTRNRELSQFGSFIHIEDSNKNIGITTGATPFVGIGTTNPTSKLHVIGNVSATAYYGDGSNLTGLAPVGGINVSNDTTTNDTRYILFDEALTGSISGINISTTKLTFNPLSGALSATDFNSLSDKNYKKNIITVDNALNKVEQLRGVSFNWKENQKPSLGVIAQEVEKILPELVSQGDIKSVNYNGIIGVLIEAIKEQQIQINGLKDMIINNKELN